MADYVWAESPGTSRQIRPKVGRTQFGDGYEERAPSGLNPIIEIWTVQHRRASPEAKAEIDAFLSARFSAISGQETFSWVPPGETVAKRFKCDEWSITMGDEVDTWNITATFERVIEA